MMGESNIINRITLKSNYTYRLCKLILLVILCSSLIFGCSESFQNDSQGIYYHSNDEWLSDNPQHDNIYLSNAENCKACHGQDLDGGVSGISCVVCHHSWGEPVNLQHGVEFKKNPEVCIGCHGQNLTGGTVNKSCYNCHHSGWSGSHGEAYAQNSENCKTCHGQDLKGGHSGQSCKGCHHNGWSGSHSEAYAQNPENCKTCHGQDLNGEGDQNRNCGYCHHESPVDRWQHGEYHTLPESDGCTGCHGADFNGGNSQISCFSCHTEISGFGCTDCHVNSANNYADSAHGNNSYGVNRSGTGYTQGECIQCHDLIAASTNELLLFAPMNNTSQTDNMCFQCHKDTEDSPLQLNMPEQYSYSYRAGDWTDDPVDDIKEAFSSSSSHNLANIVTFITGKWGFTSTSNPCTACHNPHRAQRDLHTSSNRGWPVTLPSKHGSVVSDEMLWGDDADERMSNYTEFYQAPYRNGGISNGYEPDGSLTTDGSNLTDYTTFCQDCHTTDMNTDPYNFGLSHTPIDWSSTGGESGGDKHGMNIATGTTYSLKEPYQSARTASGLTLSCNDCHEHHGASNEMLIRGEVNGEQVVIGTIGVADQDLKELCLRCHDNLVNIHHFASDAPYSGGNCTHCHSTDWNTGPTSICSNCHFHGSDDSWLLTSPDITDGSNYYTGRRTF